MDNEKSQDVNNLYKKHGVVTVSKTVMNQTTGSEEKIEIRPFITDTATVDVNYGCTMNLGNFNSLRLSVRLAVPCYVEEIQDVYDTVRDKVESLLNNEIKKAKEGAV